MVVTVNVALVAPLLTLTLVGTVATKVFPLVNAIDTPPVGAPVLSVTVPIEEFPPMTATGFKLTDVTVSGGAGSTVSVAFCVASAPMPLCAVNVIG